MTVGAAFIFFRIVLPPVSEIVSICRSIVSQELLDIKGFWETLNGIQLYALPNLYTQLPYGAVMLCYSVDYLRINIFRVAVKSPVVNV